MGTGSEHPDRLPSAVAASGHDDDATVTMDAGEVEFACELSRQREAFPAPVPGFEITRCLGEGSYGSVWLAREENTGKQVAIKFYTHRRGLDWSFLSREVEKLAVLYTSRNIVRLQGVGWESDPPYYVMEYLENGSLASLLSAGTVPAHEATRIAKAILLALVHAHGSGILHCDLKPANVLLDADYEPRICDFGQSRLSDEQNPALGTLFYMAPEQADLTAVPDARWDVYALGAILYQMLCGEAPYRTPENEAFLRSIDGLNNRLEAYRRMLNEGQKPSGHRTIPGVDRRLADIVDRCLQLDPQKRFPNAQAVLDNLELRDRQRSRRPLVTLGIVGPALLLFAMAMGFSNAMHTAVETARSDQTALALKGDAFFASTLARSLQRDLEDRESELVRIAEIPEFREAVIESFSLPWPERRSLYQELQAAKERVNEDRTRVQRPTDVSWFVNDREGFHRWRHPPDLKTMDKKYDWRDYFHGRGVQYDEDKVPKDIEPIDKPHVCLAFRSQSTNQFMVAISVPIRHPENEQVIGILARTMHLGEMLDDYGRNISGERLVESNRVVALVEQGEWKLLDHPWMTTENLKDVALEKLAFSGPIVDKLTNLTRQTEASPPSVLDHRDENYLDPIGSDGIDPEHFGGEWLAAFAPVGTTGWVVIVQERKRDAQMPIKDMEAEVLRIGLLVLVVSCALIGLLWYFVWRALNDRTLRLGTTRNGNLRGTGSSTPLSDR